MNMYSLGVMDLDLSISPDVFGVRVLMLPDDKLGRDGFHDVIIENMSGTPTWRSSYVSPAEVTTLRRQWPKAVFDTLRRRAPNCGVCDMRIYSALDVQMVACHLELVQLWRCPVTWCAEWNGSGRACLEHLAEKHGGSTLEIKMNVAQFPPMDRNQGSLA